MTQASPSHLHCGVHPLWIILLLMHSLKISYFQIIKRRVETLTKSKIVENKLKSKIDVL